MADEIPEAAIRAAAEALLRHYDTEANGDPRLAELMPEARQVLAAALPHLDEVRAVEQLRKLHSTTTVHGYCAGCRSSTTCRTVAILDAIGADHG